MEDLYEKLNIQIKKWQKQGIPVFFFRDESKKAPSVSLTMMLISFALCVFGLINKAAKLVEGLDVENSLELLLITSGLYFGRSFSKKVRKTEETEQL